MIKDLCIKIAGEAGQGVNVATLTLARAFTRTGFNAFFLTDNPNSIKLEPAWCSLRINKSPITSQTNSVNILACLFKGAIERHQNEVIENGYILYDPESIKFDDKDKLPKINYLGIPLAKIVKDLNLPELLKNTIILGAILALVDYDASIIEGLLREQFSRKGEDVVTQNLTALRAGFNHIKNNSISCDVCLIEKISSAPKIFLNGNEALSLGAIKAGCKFLAAYPMTPGSSIMHFFAAKEKEYNIVVKHAEDEIAAMNMAIGANFAGVRGMTCTSGGGFALMTEALGMAAISETPVVVAMAQRPGPSTGQPTHTSQGDLNFIINASQGEFPRIILAPGDNEECFRGAFNAFNLSEKFQVPVFILTDKYLAESYVSSDNLDTKDLKIERGKLLTDKDAQSLSDYKRYSFSPDGVSPRAIPSMANCLHLATSYEHDEYGYYEENPAAVTKMMDKRFLKLKFIKEILPLPKLYGPKNADITLIAWGSTKGPALEAIKLLEIDKISANFLHFVYIWPFPSEVAKEIASAKVTLGIEGNVTGQLANLIKENTGIDLKYKFLKYDGQPFYPVDIYNKVKEIINYEL